MRTSRLLIPIHTSIQVPHHAAFSNSKPPIPPINYLAAASPADLASTSGTSDAALTQSVREARPRSVATRECANYRLLAHAPCYSKLVGNLECHKCPQPRFTNHNPRSASIGRQIASTFLFRKQALLIALVHSPQLRPNRCWRQICSYAGEVSQGSQHLLFARVVLTRAIRAVR